MPLRRALRTMTTYGGLTVYLWRRIVTSPQPKRSPNTTNAAGPTTQHPAVSVPPTTEEPPTAPKETVYFGLDGQNYEIDLAHDEEAQLRKAFQRYIDAGRQVEPPAGRPTTTKSQSLGTAGRRRPTGQRKSDGHDSAAVRAWARANGHEVQDYGRIPANVLRAYEADHHKGKTRKR